MTPTPIKYTQVRTLRSRGPVDQEPDREVDGVLLVGDRPALEFEDRHSQAGCDAVTIYPAFTGAEPFQCWLVHRRWHAAHGYSASGVQENVIPFAQGVQIFLERGVFAQRAPARPVVSVRILGWDLEQDIFAPAKDITITSGALSDTEEALDMVARVAKVDRQSLRFHGREIWIGGACAALAVLELPPDTAQADVAAALSAAGPDEMVIGGRGHGPIVMPAAK